MKLTPLRLLVALVFFSIPGIAGEPRPFLHIREVVDEWTPDQPLRVSGDLGVSEAHLGTLEDWLKAEAPNWTVVLMRNARSQNHEGRTGMDAVEFALGQGLWNRSGFSELVEPRTGEPNGAVFVLFLEERKFSYFAAEVYDRRGLGEQHWVGRLDAPAIQAMRSGGRIVDAVKNTITSIDTSLTRKLEREVEQRRLAELERVKAIEEAKTYVPRLDSQIRKSEDRLNTFSRAHPTVTGALVRPELPKWKATLPAIALLVSAGDLANARKEFLTLEGGIEAFHRGLDRWEVDGPRFDLLEAQVRKPIVPAGASLARGRLAFASDALKSSRQNHAAGDPLYTDQLEEAVRAIGDAARHLQEWEEAETRRRAITRLVQILALLALFVFLLVANRLRAPVKKEAEALYRSWQSQLRGKFDELFELMDRTAMVVGSSRDLGARGFTGTTDQLARETIKTVDELFIMSAGTDRVMAEAESLVTPRSFLWKLWNGFSSSRYRRGIRVLSGEPIGFDNRDRLASLLGLPGADEAGKNPRALLGNLEDYEPFKLSFGKLIEAYDLRQERARGHINRLAAGIDGLPLTQQSLGATLADLSGQADALSLLATHDGLFTLQSLRETLLPAAEKSLSLAADLGKSDPVTSFETRLPESIRLVTETGLLIGRVARFRENDQPRLAESRGRLVELGRSPFWIDEGLAALVRRSEEIAEEIAGTTASPAITVWDDDLTTLTGRALGAVDLTNRAREVVTPRITLVGENLDQARLELSARLGLAPEKLLIEPGLSPVEKLEVARHGVEMALSTLDRGEVSAALQDLDEADRCLDDAGELIRLSLAGAERHPERMDELKKDHHDLAAALPAASEKLGEMVKRFAPSVLLFSAPYGDRVNGPQTVLECVDRATRLLEAAAREFGESAAAFAAGEMIRAEGLLETIANELDFARHQIALVDDHDAALKEAEAAIAPSLAAKRSRHRELGVLAADRRTCQSTLTEHEIAGVEIDAIAGEHEAGGGDPFVRLRRTEAAGQALQAVDDGIRADWKAHEMTDAATTGARAALTFCHTHLREAAHDGIPDSHLLTGAIKRHAALTRELDQIDLTLTKAHEEWPDWFNRVNALTGEVAEVRSTLETELGAAKGAVAEINGASDAIAELHRWRSRHAVSINRLAGSTGLVEAKQILSQGRYAEARQSAIAARGAARHELQQAEAAESEKVRAIAAAASLAASRRQRASSSSFRSSSGSGFSSRSSSGFSRSGSSSGSGFSRSGW